MMDINMKHSQESIMRKNHLIKSLTAISVCLLMSISTSAQQAEQPPLRQINIFVSGTDGYHTFRIPSLIVTPKGTLLAFCEGRKGGRSDTGNIDIVLKRSFDGGGLWQPMQVVWDDGDNVCGNPCPLIDRETGTIWLLLTHNLGHDSEGEIMSGTSDGSRTVWVTKSTDDGASWSKPIEITATTKKPDWTWYATGPGVGIQMRSGRLVIPCDFAVKGTKEYGSHVIVSDDNGATWKLGGAVQPMCNECQAVELSDGVLLLNMRSYHKKNRRAVATSADGGMTWTGAALDNTLVEPVCQASLLRYSGLGDGKKSRILFSNPADTKRVRMTVRMSYDECGSWPVSKVLNEGPSAYSCLTELPDGRIGCLYERGEGNAYETITFAAFTMKWLTEAKDNGE